MKIIFGVSEHEMAICVCVCWKIQDYVITFDCRRLIESSILKHFYNNTQCLFHSPQWIQRNLVCVCGLCFKIFNILSEQQQQHINNNNILNLHHAAALTTCSSLLRWLISALITRLIILLCYDYFWHQKHIYFLFLDNFIFFLLNFFFFFLLQLLK